VRVARAVGRKTIVAAIAVAAITALATGCGGDGGSDEDQIRTAVEDVQQAFADNDLEAACDRMTKAAQQHVGSIGHDPPAGCVKDLQAFAGFLKKGRTGAPNAHPAVTAVDIQGDRATARLRLGDAPPSEIPLRKDDGQWKLNALWGDLPAERQEDKYP